MNKISYHFPYSKLDNPPQTGRLFLAKPEKRWAFEHREKLMGNWELAIDSKPLFPIPPLV